MDVNLVDKQGKQSGFPVRSSVKTEDKCIRTAETGSHLCVSAMTGELSKAPKRGSSPVIAETHRWLPVSAVLIHLSSVFTELLTGKPLCLPCLSTRFTSMDTPFQVTPHYCLLSPMHPIYFWCFKTFSWHDFVSNHLPIIATHGRPKHLTRGSRGLPETARIVGWGVMATGPIVATATHFSGRRHRRGCDLNQIWKYLDSCGRAVPTGGSSWWF